MFMICSLSVHVNRIVALEQTASVVFVYPREDRMMDYPMATPNEYRQRAEECLKLATEAKEQHVRTALLELVAEFNEKAQNLKRGEQPRAQS
jgi:hypothetical protein